ncbi:MAG TPA: cytochrome c [Thermoanaerobaculia bacterium]
MRRSLILLVVLIAVACRRELPRYTLVGDHQRGRAVFSRYGCSSCHVISGVPTTGFVGPSLDRIGVRLYIAGHIPNVPQNMVQWLRVPQQMKPGTAMPNLNVTERDARDMAAYLYTLR